MNRSIQIQASYQINGYIVNSDGFINIPLLNPLQVKNLTIDYAAELIKILKEQGLLLNSTVDVKLSMLTS